MFTRIFYSILYQKFLSVQQKKEKKLKDIQIATEDVKLFFLGDNMTAYVENPNPNPQKKKKKKNHPKTENKSNIVTNPIKTFKNNF